MSGGHFNYAYFRAASFADELSNDLEENKYEWSPEVTANLREIAELTASPF